MAGAADHNLMGKSSTLAMGLRALSLRSYKMVEFSLESAQISIITGGYCLDLPYSDN